MLSLGKNLKQSASNKDCRCCFLNKFKAVVDDMYKQYWEMSTAKNRLLSGDSGGSGMPTELYMRRPLSNVAPKVTKWQPVDDVTRNYGTGESH